MNEEISVLQWNCRSIVPKLDSLKILAHETKCEVFALCETWLPPNDDGLNFPNFNIITKNRDDSYGGVLLGIRHGLTFQRLNIPSQPGIEVVAIQVQIKNKCFSIASVYIPPKASVNRQQLKNIVEMMPEPRLILGDFNSHGTGWGELYDDNRANLIYDLCDEFNLTIKNSGEITRIARPPARESRLDLSICSRTLSIDCTWNVIQDPHGSDHLPILISIATGNQPLEPVSYTYDLTKNIDWKRYALIITEAIESIDPLTPQEEYTFLANLIHSSAIQAQTKPIPSASSRMRPPSLWWDKECSEVYSEKSNSFKIYRRTGQIESYEQYLLLEIKFQNLVKCKKRNYWRTFVDGLSRETSMRTLWTTARRMRNRAPKNASEEYSDRWLHNFARKVCPDSTIPKQKRYSNDLVFPELSSAFSMIEFSVALLSCNNTASGMDGIKFNLLKNLPSDAKCRLLNLFNIFLEQNIVPEVWRQVRVIAIQKPGKPATDHHSYRPICMLSCVRKLMEKIILFRLDKWMESNGLLSDTQFGFRRGKGTQDCLALLSTEIQLAFAKKEQMASIFLDVKGAFDSVCIEVLADKLHKSGLPPLLNNFLYNLLSEKQMNFIHGNVTITRSSFMGLPQGSCLSPLLYNFYVNAIDSCLDNGCTIRQLADDCVVSVTGQSANHLSEPLQNTLNNLSRWAMELGIEFSTEKTEMVVFSRKHNPPSLKLYLLGKLIIQSLVFKYLGIWFDSKGTWACQIRYLKQKCQQRINFLRTITGTWWGAHPTDLIRLYQTTIRSVLEYGCFCFQSAAKIHMIKLERIQYRCLRIALGCMHSTHTLSLEVLAGVLPLKTRLYQLAHRTLIRCEIRNPLVIQNFDLLLDKNPQTRFMTIYHNHITKEISPSNFTPNRSAISSTHNPSVLFDLSMQQEIKMISASQRSQLVPYIFSSKYNHIKTENMFYTDGSLIEGSSGFGVFNTKVSAFHKLQNPATVYVAEQAAIHYALGIINLQPPDHYYIFSDSLSTIEALRSLKSPISSSFFFHKIKEIMSLLVEKKYKITLVWIPSHCSVLGNEKADSLAKQGALEGSTYDRIITYDEYFTIPRQESLVSWQTKWNKSEMGRWLYCIRPKVSTTSWFKHMNVERDFIRVISRLMSNHYLLNAHLYRINLKDDNLCGCGEGYHDIEHIVWNCPENLHARSQLLDSLRAQGRQSDFPVRDILASQDVPHLLCLYRFLKSIKVHL